MCGMGGSATKPARFSFGTLDSTPYICNTQIISEGAASRRDSSRMLVAPTALNSPVNSTLFLIASRSMPAGPSTMKILFMTVRSV